MSNRSKNKNAAEFFNSISSDYRTKYDKASVFHNFFFMERLHKACDNHNFNGKNVLDVGAGTGALYDYLLDKHKDLNYYASDVASGMLDNSEIPPERRFVGTINNVLLPDIKFDYIFMLGVSTYLTAAELSEHLDTFKLKVNQEDGMLIITFTNKYCFDNLFRILLKPLLKLADKKGAKVISQDITIQKYSTEQAISLFTEKGFIVERIVWLNQTVFPFNLAFPKLSIFIAKKLSRLRVKCLVSLFSSDFIIKAKIR